jgi:MYXO-CTERM domain-containing protein
MAYARIYTLPCIALAAALAAPNSAEACSPDPCFFESVWLTELAPVNHAAIPSDGVLVLQATSGGQQPFASLAPFLVVTVTRDGQPVDGALEDPGLPGVVLWRPSAPLVEDATYAVSGTFNNPAEAVENGCGMAVINLEFEFAAVAPSEQLAAPTVTADGAVAFVESHDLAHLVCCDGAFPAMQDCGGEQAYWSDGACAATKGIGYLDLDIAAVSPLAPATAGLLATAVLIDGEEVYRGLAPSLKIRQNGPVCVVVEQIDLASGEQVAASEQCVGNDVSAELGPRDLDPSAELDAQCEGSLYACEIADDYPSQWDPEQCSDVEPPPVDSEGEPTSSSDGESEGSAGESGESESSDSGDSIESGGLDDDKQGCGCTSTSADPTALLGLFVLAALARRRRDRK